MIKDSPRGRRIFLRQSVSLLSLSYIWLVACSPASKGNGALVTTNNASHASQVSNMKLRSSALKADSLIPAKYTCDGANISPPLNWDTPPTGTQSLALIVEDPDAPGGTYTHWLVYGLPTTATELPEAIPSQPELQQIPGIEGAVQGRNDFGKLGYGGPCPPTGIHRYFFKLYALDRKLNLPSGATKEQLLAAMERHILATSELIGRYTRS